MITFRDEISAGTLWQREADIGKFESPKLAQRLNLRGVPHGHWGGKVVSIWRVAESWAIGDEAERKREKSLRGGGRCGTGTWSDAKSRRWLCISGGNMGGIWKNLAELWTGRESRENRTFSPKT